MKKTLALEIYSKITGARMRCLLTLITGLILIGITTNAEADQKTLTVLLPTEFSHLDVKEHSAGDQNTVQYHIYNHLFRLNEKLEPVNELVDKYSVSEDGLVWTFDLKAGARFHDGTPCNAQAFKYSVDRMRRGGVKLQRPIFNPIKEIRVESDTRLVIKTHGRFPALRNNLAHTGAGIVCPAADQKMGEAKYGQRPVGAGPYKMEEWVRGSHITLSRFEDYYGNRPFFDRIVFKFVPDVNTRMLMIDTGEADVALRMLPEDIPRLEKNLDLKVSKIMGRNIVFHLNCREHPFDKKKVRQAANYAVDKKAIIQHILSGAGVPAHSLIEAVQYNIDAGFYKYQPEKARAMIKEAGVDGAEVRLIAPSMRYIKDIEVAQAVAGYLRKAGLKVELQAFGDWPSYMSALRKGGASMHMLGWGGSTGDPDNNFRAGIFGEKAGKLWNVGGYANPEVDRLIIAGSIEMDLSERAEIYAKIQRIAWDDAPWLFLHRQVAFMAHKSDIKGIFRQPGVQLALFWMAYR